MTSQRLEDSEKVAGPADAEPAVEHAPAGIKTFLIADVRGYTPFTQDRGDEAAAQLASKFAEPARETVDARGGSVIELRGDEALAVFEGPGQWTGVMDRGQVLHCHIAADAGSAGVGSPALSKTG